MDQFFQQGSSSKSLIFKKTTNLERIVFQILYISFFNLQCKTFHDKLLECIRKKNGLMNAKICIGNKFVIRIF